MRKTERFAVIGDPIAHSLSPIMQTAAFMAAGVDASYVSERVSPVNLAPWVRHASHVPYAGFNVTIPHKEAITSLLDVLDASVRGVGAVNTVVNDDGALIGHNTDVPGFIGTVESLRIDVERCPTVVLGAGGSARAVVRALANLDASITLCNRGGARARALAEKLSVNVVTAALWSLEAREAVEGATLVVNTTPLGMKHLPISPLSHDTNLSPRTAVIDLVYGPTTPLLRAARAAGCTAIDGIEMLVQQGATAFQLWTGIVPDLQVMRSACRQSLLEVQTCSAS